MNMLYVHPISQISEDEISFLTDGDNPDDDNVVLKKLFHPNLSLLLVSEGKAGCRYYTKVCLRNRIRSMYIECVSVVECLWLFPISKTCNAPIMKNASWMSRPK